VHTITDSKGRTTQLQYGSNGETSKMIDSAGREYLYGYNTSVSGQPQLETYTDPQGGVTRFEYLGPNEQMSKITTPEGRATTIDYFGPGESAILRVKSITRVTASTTDIDPKTSFSYTLHQDGSSETTVTDPLNNTTSYEFDTDGRPTKVTDALDRETKRHYTSNSNVDQYTAPNNTGLTPNTRLTYDSDDNLIDSATMTGSASADDLLTHTDYGPTRTGGGTIAGATHLPRFVRDEQDTASGNTSRGIAIEYENAEGNPTKYVKGTSGSVQLEYETGADGLPGRLDWTKDGKGNQTLYEYDGDDNLTSIDPPGTGLGTVSFDYSGASGDDLALSRITEVTDGRGNRAIYTYDNLDRIDVLQYTNSTGTEEARYEYDYDDDGKLTERRDIEPGITNTYTFGYDDLGRLTSEGLPGSRTNSYGYDRASNLTSLTDAGGTVSYTYDAINRQATVQEPGASSAIDYDHIDTTGDSDPLTPDHAIKRVVTLPNGVATTSILDPADRLLRTESKTSGGTVLQRFAYQYTNATSKQTLLRSRETDKDGATVDYDYDQLDRLISAANSSGDDFAYTYDSASNIGTKIVNGGTPTKYKYNEANQLCWRHNTTADISSIGCGSPPSGATSYSNDADGNELTVSGGRSSIWNRRSQLTSTTSPTGTFAYAGPGQDHRIKLSSTDIVNNILGVGSYTTNTTADYYTRDEGGAFVSQRRPSASAPNRRTYPLTDALSSTRTLIDENATVVRRYAYEPYGADITVAGSWTTTTPFKFASGEHDPSGLYHYGQRWLDPSTGRWTQQDPLNQAADVRQANRYAYVGGDPVNMTDPSGMLFPVVAALAVSTAIRVGGPRVAAYAGARLAGTRVGSSVGTSIARHSNPGQWGAPLWRTGGVFNRGSARIGGSHYGGRYNVAIRSESTPGVHWPLYP
jgi:RHS repeat-associated protein